MLVRYLAKAMLIPRMWSDEVERIGKQKCTPFGYALQGVGELIGFAGLLMLLASPVYFIYRGIAGTFHWSLLWLLLVPIGVGVLDTFIVGISWRLARRKQFKYDYERRESTWYEAGEKCSFTYADWEAANRRAG
jgi:hypothetical protein